MNLLNSLADTSLADPTLPSWKFIVYQSIIGLTTLSVISAALSVFSIYSSLSFAVPFAITGAIGITIGFYLYQDEDNRRYSYGQQIMAGVSGAVHLAAFLLFRSIVPIISGTLLSIYFTAAFYIDRDKVKA